MLSGRPTGNPRCRGLSRSSSQPSLRSAGGRRLPTAAVGRLATGRTDPQLQPWHVARLPGARLGGWFLEHGRCRPRTRLRTGRRRSAGPEHWSAAIRRVAPQPGDSTASDRLGSLRRGSARRGSASAGPGSPLRCSQQLRLPSRTPVWLERTATGIDNGIPLTVASRSIRNVESRRVETGRPLISSCISRHRPLAGQTNDPRDAGTSGGLGHQEVGL